MNTPDTPSRFNSLTSFFQQRSIILLVILLVGFVPRIGLASGIIFEYALISLLFSVLLLIITCLILMGVTLRPLLSWRPSYQMIIAAPQS